MPWFWNLLFFTLVVLYLLTPDDARSWLGCLVALLLAALLIPALAPVLF